MTGCGQGLGGAGVQTGNSLHVDVDVAGKRQRSPVSQSDDEPQAAPASSLVAGGWLASGRGPVDVLLSSLEQATNWTAASVNGSERRSVAGSHRMRGMRRA